MRSQESASKFTLVSANTTDTGKRVNAMAKVFSLTTTKMSTLETGKMERKTARELTFSLKQARSTLELSKVDRLF